MAAEFSRRMKNRDNRKTAEGTNTRRENEGRRERESSTFAGAGAGAGAACASPLTLPASDAHIPDMGTPPPRHTAATTSHSHKTRWRDGGMGIELGCLKEILQTIADTVEKNKPLTELCVCVCVCGCVAAGVCEWRAEGCRASAWSTASSTARNRRRPSPQPTGAPLSLSSSQSLLLSASLLRATAGCQLCVHPGCHAAVIARGACRGCLRACRGCLQRGGSPRRCRAGVGFSAALTWASRAWPGAGFRLCVLDSACVSLIQLACPYVGPSVRPSRFVCICVRLLCSLSHEKTLSQVLSDVGIGSFPELCCPVHAVFSCLLSCTLRLTCSNPEGPTSPSQA